MTVLSYIFLAAAVISLASTAYLYINKKEKLFRKSFGVFLVTLICFVLLSMFGEDTQAKADFVVKSKAGALGYGAGSIIKEQVPDAKKIMLFAYGTADKYADTLDAFKSANGAELVPVILMSGDPSMRVDPEPVYAMIHKAFTENNGKADAVVIDMCVQIIPECIEGFKGKILVVSTDYPVDERLSSDERILGRIKLNPRFVPENISSNPKKAFEQSYEYSNLIQ